MNITKQTVVLSALVLAGAILAVAPPVLARPGMSEANPPVRQVQPIMDTPLRDAAVCRAKDGTYYMTGTSATIDKDGKPDFHNNDGVWLWKSKDLKTWEALGQVWSIARGSKEFCSPDTWERTWRGNLDGTDSKPVRGMTTPEIHFIRGKFYICFSMNGQGTGLLVSESGKAEGPYRDLGQITFWDGDPSMFEDSDGAVYWVWGAGWIARMNDDLTGLAETPRQLAIEPETPTATYPLRIGKGGAFIFKANAPGMKQGSYHLVGYDIIPRMGGVPCHDTMIATAETVYGPYKQRDMLIPHGGQSTVFPGPDGQYYATFNGADDWAAFCDKPGIVPLVRHATVVGADYWWGGAFIKPFYPVTERGAWGTIEPFVRDINFRDLTVLNAPDGYYYLTGSDMDYNPKNTRPSRDQIGIRMWRSKDMKKWEPMGLVWRCDDTPQSREGLTKFLSLNISAPIVYDIEMHYLKGTYWLVGNIQTDKHWCEPDGHLILMLRSTSGKAEGPYEWVWKGKNDWELWTPSIFQDDDGTCYIVGGGEGNTVAKLKDDLSDVASEKWRIWPGNNYLMGEGGHIVKIGGKYIHTFRNWHGLPPFRTGKDYPRWRLFSTYDLMYSTADNLKGPWSPSRCMAPRCGNSKPFQDKNGQWHVPFFGDWSPGPWYSKPGAYPITVRQENGDVILEPVK